MADLEIRVTDEGTATRHDLMLDGTSVSRLWVNDLVMRIGVAQVHMGGIGGVGTEHEYRNRGYARRVLEHGNRWMAENGFDCATLFGIRDFYDKYGYAVCMPDSQFTIRTRDAERAEKTLEVRPFTPEDLPVLRAIYAENNADLTGSLVRDEQRDWFRKGSWYERRAEAFVFTDRSGAIAAYAARDRTDEEVVVCEVGARHPKHYGDIVRWAADRAVELREGKMSFLLPPDSPCGVYLTRFGAEQRIGYPRNSTGMGRLLRLEPFMEKTRPEWTRRAAASRALEPGLSLRLETDIGNVTLRWTGETVELDDPSRASGTVRLPQWRLMQLVMGYYGADIAPAFPHVETDGDLRLFQTLFPRRLPHMWVTDHF